MNDTPNTPKFDIAPVPIEEEMRRSYLDYAMSVIVSRALPDVRDGLKPVHRRILYGMYEGGFGSSGGTKKSARAVGEIMGKYHPHGDQSIYDALVRMAQDFSMRVTLIEGQGNFGSMDGDPPAAMRYTEAKLNRAAEALLDDLENETVDFQPNYDDKSKEPTVLPARFPNLLVNGAGGIAVGMATNIPTHNLSEAINACVAYLENPDITIDQLIEYLPGPDFPTGGIILGRNGIREAYHTGRGSIVMRGRTHIEDMRDREAIVITEVPYQQNKSRLVARIGEVVKEKLIDGISQVRDESNREGVRVVIELKRDAMSDVVLNQLFQFTSLQNSFGVNALALNRGKPELMNLKQIIAAFVEFREEVITRRSAFLLRKTREQAHSLVGLAVAVANLDPIIELIRRAPDPQTAKEQLLARTWPAESVIDLIKLIDDPANLEEVARAYQLTEAQAKAILDLRLQRLTGLEREKIAGDLREMAIKISYNLEILDSRPKRLDLLRTELLEVKEKFGTPRLTEIQDLEFEADIEALIQREDMVVTVTHGGYIKRVPLSTYRAQRRGGRGRAGMATRDEDFVSQVFVADTLTPMLFFSTRGMVYKSKVYRLPLGNPQARGKALVNLLPQLGEGETISTVMPLPEDESSWANSQIVFATASGYVRRNELSDFVDVKANGKIAMKLEDGDRLIGVGVCTEANDILLAARSGKAIRFAAGDVRVFAGRDSIGVRGIRLEDGDRVVSMSVLRHVEIALEERDAYLRYAAAKRRALGEAPATDEGDTEAMAEAPESASIDLPQERLVELEVLEEFILTVTAKGFGKRTSAYEYRVAGRGGQGIANIDVSTRNGPVVTSFPVGDDDQIMLVTDRGQLIRCPVHDIRIARRQTQGVTIFRVAEDEQVVAVAHLSDLGEDDGGNGGEETPNGDATNGGSSGGDGGN